MRPPSVRRATARLTVRLEFEGDRVHAVALARRPGTVIEEMAEVAAAPGARHLGASHPEAPILVKLDRSPSDRLEEARPTGARLVFRIGTEQLRSAGRASIDSAVGEGVLPGIGAFGPFISEHLELLRGQAPEPLLLGVGELLRLPFPALDSLAHHASLDAVSSSPSLLFEMFALPRIAHHDNPTPPSTSFMSDSRTRLS